MNSNETNLFLNQIPSDDYQLLFYDLNGCLIDQIIQVGSPDELLANITIEETSCFSTNDGSFEFEVFGGVPPYDIYFYDSSDTIVSFVEDFNYLSIDNLFKDLII